MQVVNALDLQGFAHRGPLERGLRYVKVYSHLGSSSEFVTLTGIVWRSPAQTHGFDEQQEKSPVFLERKPSSMPQLMGPWWDSWCYASDHGLWDVPGITYRNRTNYVLDVHALLREGIRIATTRRKASMLNPYGDDDVDDSWAAHCEGYI